MLAKCSISLFAVLLLGVCHTVNSQIPFPNSCPDVKIVENFDLDRYMGTWYEYSKYPFIFEAAQKCQHAVYTNNGNGTVAVTNTGLFVIINRPNSISGTAKVIAPGQLAVAFRNQKADKPNYLVLGTDYDNWAVVYSCTNITSYGHAKLIWILTRQRIPAEDVVQTAEQVLKDNNLSLTFLIKSTQDNCPSVTEPDNEDQIASSTTDDQPIYDFPSTTVGNLMEVA